MWTYYYYYYYYYCVLNQLSPNRALYTAGKECDGILWSFLHRFKV